MQRYRPVRQSRSQFFTRRGLLHHVRSWEPDPTRECEGTLVMLHGWMDVSASFQFLVDALVRNWRVFAPDWRGYGLTDRAHGDCYWFPDYLADLDQLLDALLPGEPVNLVAHSMGGNVAMIYAGVRPARVRKLVNLEGVGLPGNAPDEAPARYARWLDELRDPPRTRDYASREDVARRLMRNDPRLGADRAGFLAEHWARPGGDGGFELAGDPSHKIVNPVLYRVEEVLACWRGITADVLLLFAGDGDRWHEFVNTDAYRARLAAIGSLETRRVAEAGHMMHHDRPDEIARLVEEFVG